MPARVETGEPYLLFIDMLRPTGGDPNRKALNLHHGIVIPDSFMRAVEADEEWALKSPKDGAVQTTVSARDLWIRILTARVETGEPYLLFIDSCLLYTSPSPRDGLLSRMPSSA